MTKPDHSKTFNRVVGGLKGIKAISNALGTSPTETPDVAYKKENTNKLEGKKNEEKKEKKPNGTKPNGNKPNGNKPNGNKPKAGTPGTTVDVQLDENGYQTDY